MYKETRKQIGMITLFLVFASFVFTAVASAREITDMAGHRVTVPETISKVYAPSPYGSYIMYAIAPDKLAGLIFPVKDEDKKLLHESVRNLPVIGGLFGQGQTANIEMLLKAKPDVIVMWSGKKTPMSEKTAQVLNKINLPYAYATVDDLSDYPDAFLFLGKLMGREKRTEKLSAYCSRTLSEVRNVMSRIPAEKRPRVYYAEGTDGLSTECNDSIHVQLLQLAGDVDVHRCRTSCHKGYEKISPEQVMLYNPDVIIAQEKVFYNSVFKDPRWQRVKAVKEGRVYLVPRHPFNWFDRPPSFMRFIGLKWLMSRLYPDQYKIDIVREARDFYKLFLGVDVSNAKMKKIMEM
jgi:iron complex transport system substrate-binding protein